jgi:hypothetical protein
MALRIPERTTDQLTVISWLDDAIDREVDNLSDLIDEYLGSSVPDPSIFPLRKGEQPTEFVLRPLSEREFACCEDMAKVLTYDHNGQPTVMQNAGELVYQLMRFGIVEVRNLEGFKIEREQLYSTNVLTVETVNQIDRHTAQFLGLTIRRWSHLEKKTSNPSGSLPISKSGTNPIPEGSSHLTAVSASNPKDTETCTVAKKKGRKRAQ